MSATRSEFSDVQWVMIPIVAQVLPPPSDPANRLSFRNCLGSDRSFKDVGIEIDPAVGQKA